MAGIRPAGESLENALAAFRSVLENENSPVANASVGKFVGKSRRRLRPTTKQLQFQPDSVALPSDAQNSAQASKSGPNFPKHSPVDPATNSDAPPKPEESEK
ncbi:hypothetical protein [Rhodoblastus sp.]|uniref:hypothetical protein n=1 Tax=Rhodoblastus sp. TaxID=1962975 RepID=UPI0035B2A6A6